MSETAKTINQYFGIVILIPFTMLTFFVNGQLSLGFEAGLTHNYITTNISNRSYTLNKPDFGYIIKIPVKYKIKNNKSFQIEFEYLRKNYSFKRTNTYAGIYDNYKNSYFQIPVILNFAFGKKKISGFLNGGGYCGLWLSSSVKGTIPNILNIIDSVNTNGQIFESIGIYSYAEKIKFDSRKDKRIEIGLAVGGGMNYAYNKRITISLRVSYYYAVTDQHKKSIIFSIPKYNNTSSLSMGFMYSIKK